MNEVELWWRGLPPVTRYIFTISIGLTVATYFGFINQYNLIFNWDLITKNLQVNLIYKKNEK